MTCIHPVLAALLGGGELMVVLVVALILFGSKRIPEFAKGIGQAMKEFKKASSDVSYEIHNALNQETPPPPSPPPAKQIAAPEPVAPESATPADTVPKS
jgi:sec-independent protein translocase protein TatA